MFQSEIIKTDVTAVRFYNNYILAGIGNFLNIFDKNGDFITRKQIFDSQSIQGIDFFNNFLLIYGGCCIKLLKCCSLDPITLEVVHDTFINDWILAAKWLELTMIAVVVMNNKLLLFNGKLEKNHEVACEVSCILYSAFIAYEMDKIIIFSGTVFGEILIWTKSGKIATKLVGHKGVIFSISYIPTIILSTSDDRSAILWTMELPIHQELNQEVPKITLNRKLYGHQSRIFRCLISDVIITGGEDSYINIWDFHGNLLNKIETQHGGSIWSLDYEKNTNTIVSGNGSGGILLSSVKSNQNCYNLSISDTQRPKKIAIFGSNNIAVITESGDFFYYNKNNNSWLCIDTKSKYNILEMSKCRKLVSVCSCYGNVRIYKETDTVAVVTKFQTADNRRIRAFHWLSCNTFLICNDQSQLDLFIFIKHQITLVCNFFLPKTKDNWSTAACYFNTKYAVGDRRGNIYIYKLNKTLPIWTFRKAHSHLGITDLIYFDSKLISLGRDGNVKFWTDSLRLVNSDKLPIDWLARFDQLTIIGFSANRIIVYDLLKRRNLWEFCCGGGHRSWDLHEFLFVYIKDGVVKLIDYSNCQSIDIACKYHSNTVNSVKIINVENDRFLLISGSDDTDLQIFTASNCYFESIKIIKSHLSSIRSICVYKVGDDCLIMTGGGRGQIICWKYNNDLIFEDCHYEKSHQSEVRIMDMKITAVNHTLLLLIACSDGNINIFKVNHENDSYKLKYFDKFFYKLKCVSKILLFYDFLLSFSNDGYLTFYQLFSKQSLKCVKIHQSGITSCDIYHINDRLTLVLTGGDDGAVVLTLFNKLTVLKQINQVGLHCAQVTGVWFFDTYFITASIDQKVLLYSWKLEEELSCKLLGKYVTSVPDIQGVECYHDLNYFHIFLYGNGFEYVKVGFDKIQPRQ